MLCYSLGMPLGPCRSTPKVILGLAILAASGCARAGFGPDDVVGAFDLPHSPVDSGGVHDASSLPDAPRPDSVADSLGSEEGPALFACDPAADALAVCYSFEGAIVDGSSNGNDPVEAVDVTFAPGVEGQALFHGATSRVVIPDHASFNGGTERTIEFSFRLDQAPSGGRFGLVDKHYGFGIFVYDDLQLTCSQGDPGSTVRGSVPIGQWTHVACLSDGVSLQLYLGGTLVDTQSTVPLTTSTTDIFLGSDSPDGSDPLIGRIDNFRIWRSLRPPN